MRLICNCAPALVAALVWASGASAASVMLHWTAPGDDGLQGRATSYDLRYHTVAITEASFLSAFRVPNVPPPSPAGTAEAFTVSGLLVGMTYYFALKTVDDVGNGSGISNVIARIVSAPVDVPGGGSAVLRFSAPWPNPARQSATFALGLPSPADVEVCAYDIRGRRVRTLLSGMWPAGELRVIWNLDGQDGARVPPGVYLVRARIGGESFDRRVAVVH